MARASGASDYRSGELSHQDERGAAHMVDITEKATTKRTAVAAGILRTSAQVVALISTGGLPKGDALATARVAGIMAAKRTSDLIPLCHQLALTGVDVIITSGGTGISPTDTTPEHTVAVLDYVIPGLADAIRRSGLPKVPTSVLSRGVCGVAGRTLIINLPGSPGGVRDGLGVLADVLDHALEQIAGGDHPR